MAGPDRTPPHPGSPEPAPETGTGSHPTFGEQVLDLMVYLPVGVVSALLEDAPDLASKGRAAVEQRVRTARGIGQVTVVLGRRTIEKRLREVLASPSEPAAQRASDGAVETPGPAATAGPSAAPPDEGPAPVEPARSADPATTVAQVDAVIAGYDTLPASQVVRRLEGLAAGELDVVDRYERAGRGRRTILHRVRQIQAEAGGDPSAGPPPSTA